MCDCQCIDGDRNGDGGGDGDGDRDGDGDNGMIIAGIMGMVMERMIRMKAMGTSN